MCPKSVRSGLCASIPKVYAPGLRSTRGPVTLGQPGTALRTSGGRQGDRAFLWRQATGLRSVRPVAGAGGRGYAPKLSRDERWGGTSTSIPCTRESPDQGKSRYSLNRVVRTIEETKTRNNDPASKKR